MPTTSESTSNATKTQVTWLGSSQQLKLITSTISQSCQRSWKSWSRFATLVSLWSLDSQLSLSHCHTRSPHSVDPDSTNSANCVQLYDHLQLMLPRHRSEHSSRAVWTTATRCCTVCPTASPGSRSQSRTLLHVWLLVPDGEIILACERVAGFLHLNGTGIESATSTGLVKKFIPWGFLKKNRNGWEFHLNFIFKNLLAQVASILSK